jgi:hypothetical protein
MIDVRHHYWIVHDDTTPLWHFTTSRKIIRNLAVANTLTDGDQDAPRIESRLLGSSF